MGFGMTNELYPAGLPFPFVARHMVYGTYIKCRMHAWRDQKSKRPGFTWKPGLLPVRQLGCGYSLVAAAPTRTAAAAGAAAPTRSSPRATALLGAIAVGAVNGPVATGRERHLGVFTTLGANRRVHLAFAPAIAAATTTTVAAAPFALCLADSAAIGAATRGAETLGLVKLLFTVSERELLAAVGAGKVLVCHVSLANSYL